METTKKKLTPHHYEEWVCMGCFQKFYYSDFYMVRGWKLCLDCKSNSTHIAGAILSKLRSLRVRQDLGRSK